VSYAAFLAVFLAAPLAVLILWQRRRITRRLLLTLTAVSVVAVLYTAPWDNLIIANGVWSYGPGKVLGVIVGHIPLEEYVFYVLQVFLTGLVTAALLRRLAR
jgi:lycopene cyclase domain-containing protein